MTENKRPLNAVGLLLFWASQAGGAARGEASKGLQSWGKSLECNRYPDVTSYNKTPEMSPLSLQNSIQWCVSCDFLRGSGVCCEQNDFLPQNIVYDNSSKWCCNLISPIFQNVLSAHDSLGCSLLSDKAPPHPWFSCVAAGRGHSGNAEGAGLHPMLWQWCTAGGTASQVPFLPVF